VLSVYWGHALASHQYSMTPSTNGCVVRAIKQINKIRWKNPQTDPGLELRTDGCPRFYQAHERRKV
jgi:hypothetical protein